MSFHNRLLLNRLAVNGHKTLEVLLLVKVDQFEAELSRLSRLDALVTRGERSIGYIRATVSLERFLELVGASSVDAYQIASLSKAGWYRDGAPQENAEMFRRYEVSLRVPPSQSGTPSTLPLMTVDAAHRINRAADSDVGIDEWLEEHPTYDGRGVTIALLETAQAEFDHPAFRSAKTLDGLDVPKFAGIFNPIDLDEPDETRVDLGTELLAVSAWHRVGTRTYIVPGPGKYRLGFFKIPAESNLAHEFGVLRDVATGEIRVDTDGDADFREEQPIAPSATAIHTQQLHIVSPRKVDIAFAITEGRSPRHINIYVALNDHQTMTASVAAGNRNNDSLAYGVAPGARVLLVRNTAADLSLRATLEAYLDTMQRPDVDILCDSTGIHMLPNTSADFSGLFLSRLIGAYGKPIFHSAGNAGAPLNNVWSLGDVFAVGGSVAPDAFADLYGGGKLTATMVDPRSASGPALDGALKPDFIVPMGRIAASVFLTPPLALPQNDPTVATPTGYEISCCTSATSPYAAGVAALLLSATKQVGVRYSVASLEQALRASARPLPAWPTYKQGSGVLQVGAAWAELRRNHHVPEIEVVGHNVHALSQYAANGNHGPGLFEREGWHAGMTRQRVLTFTRRSGPIEPAVYRLSWMGNDGTFATARSIELPLGQPINLSVSVHPVSSGAHSAILNLHDSSTDAVLVRTQATVVPSVPLNAGRSSIQVTGVVPLLDGVAHYLSLPENVQAIRLDLEVLRGSVKVSVLRSYGIERLYYWHLDPSASRSLPPGKHTLVMPTPTPGTWSVVLKNTSAVHDAVRGHVSTADAEYRLSAQILRASLEPRIASTGAVHLDIANHAAPLVEPAVDVSTGALRIHEGRIAANGLPSEIPIEVPSGSSTLRLKLRGADASASLLDLHLYDCTTGECFSYDFTLPAGPSHIFVVRQPKPGRWVAAVNSAPSPAETGRFVLEEIITRNTVRHYASEKNERMRGARWREQLKLSAQSGTALSDSVPIALFELVDAAAERDALTHPWENRDELPNLAERSVAVGTAVLRLP